MSFWFGIQSGKNCYMISARELNIVNGDDIYEWCWFSIPEDKHRFHIPDCRFPEVVMRLEINQLEIGSKIPTSLLSPMTTYVAYLVFAGNRISVVDDCPVEVAGSNNRQNRTVYFHREHQDGDDDGFFPKKRVDGWVESELGEFFNRGDEEGELLMTIKTRTKEFLLVQGIEVRPKKE